MNRLPPRRRSEPVQCGSVTIGGDAPVSIQTMTKTDTRNVEATVVQIRQALSAGAEIVRVAVVDAQAAEAIRSIKEKVPCPIVADIHFDYRLAVAALESGADKIRINPGNIGGPDRFAAVLKCARERGACVRIGVNSGSIEKDILARYGGPTPEAMVESALRYIGLAEKTGFRSIVVSLKSSSVRDTVEAYLMLASRTPWPFHIGITEAGPGLGGIVKSACGIGTLLCLGVGDTLRVSLTAPPEEEAVVARYILQSTGVRAFGPEVISCPTCGRTQVDLAPIARAVSDALLNCKVPIKVAVMGCPVNGPGEAREAEVGVACGRDGGILFRRGVPVGRARESEIVERLIEMVEEEGRRE